MRIALQCTYFRTARIPPLGRLSDELAMMTMINDDPPVRREPGGGKDRQGSKQGRGHSPQVQSSPLEYS